MISGNVASYSRCLNDPSRLQEIQELNAMTAALAEVKANQDSNKRQRAEEAAARTAASEARKRQKEAHEAVKKAELAPELHELMGPFFAREREATVEEFSHLKVPQLRNLIKYYYEAEVTGLGTMKHGPLVDKLMELHNGD